MTLDLCRVALVINMLGSLRSLNLVLVLVSILLLLGLSMNVSSDVVFSALIVVSREEREDDRGTREGQ